MKPVSIIFMGSDPIALPLLEYLRTEASGSVELKAVFSQPDRPKGRGKKLQPNAIAAWSQDQGIPTFKPLKPGKAEAEWLRDEGIALVLVMAYGHIVKQDFLDTPELGCVNFHASLLPAFRGASPIETAVATGANETGVSLMRMVRAMDAGPVLGQARVPILAGESALLIREKIAQACPQLLADHLEVLLSGKAIFEDQDTAGITYCRKLVKDDGQLDFNASAEVLAARINGLDPWPGCFCQFADVRLKLREAYVGAETVSGQPGEILQADATGISVATGAGVIRIQQWQRPGGKMLPAREFLLGFPLEVGALLASAPMSDLQADT